MAGRNRLLLNCYNKPYEKSCGFYFALEHGVKLS
nr:MAG TPA: hypothetical protein [Caudoviricetes sp.]